MKPPPPLERHIQAQMVQYLKLHRWNVWQMQLGSQHGDSVWCTQGIPDMYVFKPGHAFWIEVKRPKLGRACQSSLLTHLTTRKQAGRIERTAQGGPR